MWGKYYWAVIHIMTMQHDHDLTEDAEKMIIMILKNLPCPGCSKHAQDYLLKHPFPKDKTALEWGIRFHNEVNIRTGKEKMSIHDAKNTIKNMLLSFREGEDISKEPTEEKSSRSVVVFLSGLVICTLIGTGLFLYLKRKREQR